MTPRLGSRMRVGVSVLAISLALGARPLVAQEAPDLRARYTKADYMVPMRDGVKLFTIVYAPRDTTRTYPVLLLRTPYSIPPYEPELYRRRL